MYSGSLRILLCLHWLWPSLWAFGQISQTLTGVTSSDMVAKAYNSSVTNAPAAFLSTMVKILTNDNLPFTTKSNSLIFISVQLSYNLKN